MFNELSDNSPALLSPAKSEPVIELGERQAVITNGKIHAVLSLQDWGDELQISYYNQKGELLLQEIPNGGALFLKARRFQSLPGDSFFPDRILSLQPIRKNLRYGTVSAGNPQFKRL
ncbi:MAG: hypothetical protein ACLR09_13550 [Gallintestinimicrobium sp.]